MQRPGGHEIGPNALGTEIPGHVAHSRLQRDLAHTHPVVDRPGSAVGVEVQPDQ